jgi:hypothetical protein
MTTISSYNICLGDITLVDYGIVGIFIVVEFLAFEGGNVPAFEKIFAVQYRSTRMSHQDIRAIIPPKSCFEVRQLNGMKYVER